MTVFAKTYVNGIDAKLKEVQNFLNTELAKVWTGTINIYGKIEETETKQPEVYSSGNDYVQPLFNDTVNASIAFKVLRRTFGQREAQAEIDLICTCKLTSIHGNTERNDEKAMLQLSNILAKRGILISEIKTGVSSVLSGYDIEQIKYENMQPFLCFALSFTINYSTQICNQTKIY